MSAMRGYKYENLDEYETDGDEEDNGEDNVDEYEEEVVYQPTPEELKYLEIRQKLKDTFRKQMKTELGTSNSGSRDKIIRKDNYGSFFGPSQPVIAQRVIQESKSLLENPNLAIRLSKPNHPINKKSASAPNGSKPQQDPPKVTNVLKRKVEMIKNTRDYSFLLSEDAELPASMKSPPPRNVSAPKSEAQSAQQLPRNKQVVNDPRRAVPNDRGRAVPNDRNERKKVFVSSQSRPKVGMQKMGPTSKLSVESRKQLGSTNYASGPGRPVCPEVSMPSKSPGTITQKQVGQPVPNNKDVPRKPMPPQPQQSVRKPIAGPHRPPTSHSQSSLPKMTTVQRKPSQDTSKPNVTPRHRVPSSRDEVKRVAQKNAAAPRREADQRPKAKLGKRPHVHEVDIAFAELRKFIGDKAKKYHVDDDTSDMEANFSEIQAEEKRSARLAQEEDAEEERKENERLMRVAAKKRKMSR